jgi:hypothetical protein
MENRKEKKGVKNEPCQDTQGVQLMVKNYTAYKKLFDTKAEAELAIKGVKKMFYHKITVHTKITRKRNGKYVLWFQSEPIWEE